MKVPYSWLAEWVKVPWKPKELGARLTMAGFELEGLESAAPPFTGVVVADILSAERHPQADKLQVCKVTTGSGPGLQIVCGAANARAGLKSALALVGAQLPGDLKIGAARLRGVESQGMLASARELGLAESSSGILELPADAPLGKPLREYLSLDEAVLEVNITPNRGDAMSILGIAREVAAIAGTKITGPRIESPRGAGAERFPVKLEAPAGCPRFAGCIVRGINNRAATPVWLAERLRRAGVRSISPVVDVTNYVMLELGQPMHAYDLAKLKSGIRVRLARAGEEVTLLDGKTLKADADMLLITDAEGPVGLAGIMGGLRTAVQPETTDVFFESAYFSPEAVQGRGRRSGLLTDASQRFERGVDPTQQARAIARAIALLAPIAGGTPASIVVTENARHLPKRAPVRLRAAQLKRLLGMELPAARVAKALTGLGMKVSSNAGGWKATPPAHRFDIAIEADLIEEVARLAAWEKIPETDALGSQHFRKLPEEQPAERAVLEALAARGYEEAVTYAFVDPALQEKLFPGRPALALANPIASDMSVMRVSLWPGLIRAALENQRRQQDRIRLFEHGTRFELDGSATHEIETIAGLASGARLPEQWGVAKEARVPADFYDVKADVAALIAGTGAAETFSFEPRELAALHPGRSARVLRRGSPVGWIGELHPALVKALDFTYAPVLFELDMGALAVKRAAFEDISRFPQVRRDLAVVVDEAVTLSTLAERVTLVTSSLLRGLRVFDVYRGPGLEPGRKSIALGLIFQDISRTLTDEDVDRLMASVVTDLRESLNARIRE
ncbi:MAG TPA: phenylalanine--tRNA ligase subunit beta [Steroidobacteraceae bacterium]|nr:phenylalanine--tRNA ligase subunit beta [Steroidobacteraceae bacterium]HEV2443295.1 phenylalanine--tRNA ligase subunit beta [Steroidobacteraceae bacterium]